MGVSRYRPLRNMTSARLSPRAFTRRRISPGPGSGSGSSSNWRTSAGPVLWKRTIFTVLDIHTPGLLTHHLDGHEIVRMQDWHVSAHRISYQTGLTSFYRCTQSCVIGP